MPQKKIAGESNGSPDSVVGQIVSEEMEKQNLINDGIHTTY